MPSEKKKRTLPFSPRSALFAFLLALLVAVCGFFLGFSLERRLREAATAGVSAVELSGRLEKAEELITMSYYYTNMGQFKNSSEFYGVTVPFTTKSFILTYDGVIKAGIRLADADISVDEKTVTVSLPFPVILSHTIDEESLQVFDEKTSIFNPFRVEDYNGFQRDQKAEMEAKAVRDGLLQRADGQALAAVEQILRPVLPEQTVLTVTHVR